MTYEKHGETKARTGVFAVERSDGVKVGDVSATYVTQATCPATCPFLGNGCYAENGFTGGFITKRLNRNVDQALTLLDLARNEAAAIDHLTGERDLRLHIVGDSPTVEGTRLLALAAERYIARGGMRVWTYTHAWRYVPREAWGPISVLASCETPADIMEAHALGYATAIVTERHPGRRAYALGPLNILPCPEQTSGVTCADCRLCTDEARLRDESLTIAFAAHGKPVTAMAAIRERRAIAAR